MGAAIPPERRAKILVDAIYMGETKAANKHHISRRSIVNWKIDLENDPEFSRIFQKMSKEREKSWADEIPAALKAGIGFLRNAANTADIEDPEAIKAITGGIQTLSEISITKDIIDARLNGADRPNNQATG